MSIPEFEPEPDFAPFTGYALANDDEGQLLVNEQKMDEFDPRIHNDVEGLLFLGLLTHDCELFGHTFTLKTLTRGERLAVSLFVREFEDTLGLADAMETAILAQAITLVDHRPLSISLGNETPEQQLRRKFEIIQRWHDPIIEALYTEYSQLLVRQKLALQELELKSRAGRATFEP